MKKLLFAIAFILPLAGCACGDANDSEDDLNSVPMEERGKVDPSVATCGEFEAGAAYDASVVESHYEVCKNASDGTCYIKTWYPVPKQGCDLEFGTYRNGNPVCFNWIHNIHDLKDGRQFGPQSLSEYRPADQCAPTTEAFFRGKVEQK